MFEHGGRGHEDTPRRTFVQKFKYSCIRSTSTHEFGLPVGFTSQLFEMISL